MPGVKFGEILLVLPQEEKELFVRLEELLERMVVLEEKMLRIVETRIQEKSDPDAVNA